MAKRNISVEMEDVLISEIEEEMIRSGFSTRSEFIKTAIRQYIQNQHDKRVWEAQNQANLPPGEKDRGRMTS